MGGSYLIEICAFSFMALLVPREGMYETGGHQIIANLAALSYIMPMAVGIDTASLTAQAIGARDAQKARATGSAGIRMVVVGAVLTATLLVGARAPILRAYTHGPPVSVVRG